MTMANGKIALPVHSDDHRKPTYRSTFARLLLIVLFFSGSVGVYHLGAYLDTELRVLSLDAPVCPVQGPALEPTLKLRLSDADKNRSIALLSEAVQLATVSYDDNGKPTEEWVHECHKS